jgi:hypothetical protein
VTVTVTITQGGDCPWTVLPGDVFISANGPVDRRGDGTVTLNVAANTGAARSGTATIAGRIVTVAQDAAAPASCVFSVTPRTVALPVGGGTATFSVTVTQGTGCAWTTEIAGTGLTIRSGASGTGDGTVIVDVAANPGRPRVNGITIAGQFVTISQPENPGACAYSITPRTFDVSSAAQTVAFDVTITTGAPDYCGWSIGTQGPPLLWVQSMTPSGNTTHVVLAMSANTGAVDRMQSATVADLIVTIRQAGGIPSGPCKYDVTPTSIAAPAAGTSATVVVSLAQGSVFSCSWSVVPNAPFISVVASPPNPETGGAQLTVAIAPNPGAARTATVTVAGTTVAVSQAGTLPLVSR